MHAREREIDRTTPRDRRIYKGTGQQNTSDIAWNDGHWPIVGCRHTDSPYRRINCPTTTSHKQTGPRTYRIEPLLGIILYAATTEYPYTWTGVQSATRKDSHRQTVRSIHRNFGSTMTLCWFYIPNHLFGNARLARYSRSRALVSGLAAADVVIVAVDSHVPPL